MTGARAAGGPRRVVVLRHGQCADNVRGVLNGHRDAALTDLGRDQAVAAASELRELAPTIDLVWTSPLRRARVTAELVAEHLGLPAPRIEPGLIERDFGSMTGLPVSSIRTVCGDDVLDTDDVCYFLSPPGAETFPDLLGRAEELVGRLREQRDVRDVLLVTHGDIGKMIVGAVSGRSWRTTLADVVLGNAGVVVCPLDP